MDAELLHIGMQKRNREIDLSWEEIGKKFGIPGEKARTRIKSYAKRNGMTQPITSNLRTCNESINESSEEVNTKEVTINHKRIITLQEAIKICKIDLNIWKVERWVCNKWEVGRKATSKKLQYTDGKKDGYEEDTGGINVEPLFQIKIWLIKIRPDEQKFPCIKPVNVNITPVKIKKKKSSKMKRALVIGDSHNGYLRNFRNGTLEPFHDRRCWDIVLQIAEDIQPDEIICLGDMLDLPEWSDKFIQNPRFYQTTQPAVEELAWWFGQLRKICPNTKIIYLEANHEVRMTRAIYNNITAAYNLEKSNYPKDGTILSVPYLLNLKDLDIEYLGDYPNNQYWLNDRVSLSHGHVYSSKSGDTVKKLLAEAITSEGVGHIHRIEKVGKTVHKKDGIETYIIFSPGCMCRLDGIVPAKKAKNNWQNGIGHIYYEEGDGNFQVDLISIMGGFCIFEGSCYTAQDRLKEINLDINWNFA